MIIRGKFIILLSLVFLLLTLSSVQPAVRAQEDVSLLDTLEFYGGPLYTRPAMTEFMDYFGEFEEAVENLFEDIEEDLEEAYEDEEIDDYEFSSSYDFPEGPVGSFGFHLGLAAENERGIRAATGYERFYVNFSGEADYNLWVSEETNEDEMIEVEEEEIFEQNIDLAINAVKAEFTIPLLLRGDNTLENFLQYFNFTAGGGYYWGSGEIETLEEYVIELTDADGETEKEEIEEETIRNIEADGDFGLNAGIGFSMPVYENLTVFADVMYRFLDMDLEIEEEGIFGIETVNIEEDMSGLKFRAGLGYQF